MNQKHTNSHPREGGDLVTVKSVKNVGTHIGFRICKLLRNASGMTVLMVIFLLSPAHADSNVLCDTVNHIPRDDVTYKPSPNVVSADLNAVPIEIGDVEIPLTAFLAQDLGLETPVSVSKLGNVTIKENGSVVYGGKDISHNVVKLCGQPKQITEKIIPKPKKQDGQVKVEAVKSQKLKELKVPEPVQSKTKEENLYGGFGQDYINGTYND